MRRRAGASLVLLVLALLPAPTSAQITLTYPTEPNGGNQGPRADHVLTTFSFVVDTTGGDATADVRFVNQEGVSYFTQDFLGVTVGVTTDTPPSTTLAEGINQIIARALSDQNNVAFGPPAFANGQPLDIIVNTGPPNNPTVDSINSGGIVEILSPFRSRVTFNTASVLPFTVEIAGNVINLPPNPADPNTPPSPEVGAQVLGVLVPAQFTGSIAPLAPTVSSITRPVTVTFPTAPGDPFPPPAQTPFQPGQYLFPALDFSQVADGIYQVQVSAVDAAANPSPATTRSIVEVNVDRIRPVPTVTVPAPNPLVVGDGSTPRSPRFNLQGVVSDERGGGTTVAIQVLDTSLSVLFTGQGASAPGNGIFSLPLDFTPGGPIVPALTSPQEVFRIDVRAIDIGGNLSTPPVAAYVVVDARAPEAPVITEPLDGGSTASTAFFIRGFVENRLAGQEILEEHGTVQVRVTLVSGVDPSITAVAATGALPTSTLHGSVLDDPPGFGLPPGALGQIPDQFLFDLQFNLSGFPLGPITATAEATDEAGNTSAASQPVTFQLGSGGPVVSIDLTRSGPDDNDAFLPLVANRFGSDDGDLVNGAPGFFVSLKSPERFDAGDPPAAIIPGPPFPPGGTDPGTADQLLLSVTARDVATPIQEIVIQGASIPTVVVPAPGPPMQTTSFTTSIAVDITGLPEGFPEFITVGALNTAGLTGATTSLVVFRDIVPASPPRVQSPPLVPVPFGTGTLDAFFTGQDRVTLSGTAPPNALILVLVPPVAGNALPVPRTTNQSVPDPASALKPPEFPTDPARRTRADASGAWTLADVDLSGIPLSITTPTPILLQAVDTFDNTDPVESVLPVGVFRTDAAGDIAEIRLDPRGRDLGIFPGAPPAPILEQFFAREALEIRVTYSTILTEAPTLTVTQFGAPPRTASLVAPAPAPAAALTTQVVTYRYQVISETGTFDGPAAIALAGGLDAFGFRPNPGGVARAFFVDTVPPAPFPGGPTSFTPVTGSAVSALTTIEVTALDAPADNGSEEASCLSTTLSEIRLIGPLEALDPATVPLVVSPTLPPSQGVTVPCEPFTFTFAPTAPVTRSGTYEIQGEIGDNVGNQAPISSAFILDTVPIPAPFVRCQPADGSFVSTLPRIGTTQAVFVTVLESDVDLVTSVVRLLDPQGTSIGQTPLATGRQTLVVPVIPDLPGNGRSDGLYRIVSDLFDRAGNPSPTVTCTFTLDTVGPGITGAFPADLACIGPPLREVRARIEDAVVANGFFPAPSGVDRDRSRIELRLLAPTLPNETRAGAKIPGVRAFRDTTGTADASVLALEFVDGAGRSRALPDDGSEDGIYAMEVTAVDRAGNTTTALGRFVYDSQPPHVTLDFVPEDAFLADTFVVVGGEAFDPAGCGFTPELLPGRFTTDSVQVAIVGRGAGDLEITPVVPPYFDFTNVSQVVSKTDAATSVVDHSSWAFVAPIPDRPGPARLKVRVRDRAGNVDVITRNITIRDEPLPPPDLLAPPDGLHTPDKVVRFDWSSVIRATTYDMELARVTPTNLTTSTTFVAIPFPRHGFGPVDLTVFAAAVPGGTPISTASQFRWRVRSNDFSLNPGPYSTPTTFVVDPTPPAFASIAVGPVPAAPPPVLVEGTNTVVIGFAEDTAMVTSRIEVMLRPRDPTLPLIPLETVSFEPLRWTGELVLPVRGITGDLNGPGEIVVRRGANLAGTPLPEVRIPVVVDLGPFFGLRFFGNPVIPEELEIIVKAFPDGGSLDPLELTTPPTVLARQHGAAGPVRLPVQPVPGTLVPSSAFRTFFRVDTRRIGFVDVTVTGTNLAGRTATRIVSLAVARAVALAGARFFLAGGAGLVELEPGSLEADQLLMASDGVHLGAPTEAVLGRELVARGLTLVARHARFEGAVPALAKAARLEVPGAASVGATAPAGDGPDTRGLYVFDPDTGLLEWVGGPEEGRLTGSTRRLGLILTARDAEPPVLELEVAPETSWDGRVRLVARIDDRGSGVEASGVRIETGSVTLAGEPLGSGRFAFIPRVALPEGRHTMTLVARDRSGNVARTRHEMTVAGALEVLQAVAVPNPVRGAFARIRYRLSRPASSVTVHIHDVTGRRLASLDGPTFPGANEVFWDLTRRGGNRVGPGVYLFRLTARDASGRKVRADGKIAVLP